MTRKPPLTHRAHGSTRCVHCGRRFTEDTRATVEAEATDYVGGRPNYSANRPVQVTRRWHAACLEEFEADRVAYRQQVEADRAATISRYLRQAGLE